MKKLIALALCGLMVSWFTFAQEKPAKVDPAAKPTTTVAPAKDAKDAATVTQAKDAKDAITVTQAKEQKEMKKDCCAAEIEKKDCGGKCCAEKGCKMKGEKMKMHEAKPEAKPNEKPLK